VRKWEGAGRGKRRREGKGKGMEKMQGLPLRNPKYAIVFMLQLFVLELLNLPG